MKLVKINRTVLLEKGISNRDADRIITALSKSRIPHKVVTTYITHIERNKECTRHIQLNEFCSSDVLDICNEKLASKDPRTKKELWALIKGIL